MSSGSRSRIPCVLAALAFGAGVLTASPKASAQVEDNSVSARGKGIAGGILLGAEVVLITTGLIGVKEWWPYVVFGAVGAGGGAVGGYFVEQVHEAHDGPAEPALYMLAGGLALVIPTLVVVLNATAYDPIEDEDLEQQDGEGGGEVDGEVEGNVEVDSGAWIPPAVIGVDAHHKHARVGVGVPIVEVRPLYSATEQVTYGVGQQTEVRFPIVRGVF